VTPLWHDGTIAATMGPSRPRWERSPIRKTINRAPLLYYYSFRNSAT
jgi:hypothetical protein